MVKSKWIFLLLAVLLGSLSSCIKYTNDAAVVPSSISPREKAIAERLFILINNDRKSQGLKRVDGHSGVIKLAQDHSNSLARKPSGLGNHAGSINRARYSARRYGIENQDELIYAVTSGESDPAAATLRAWKLSPSYRRKLDQAWSVVGIGVKYSRDGTAYVTMCMGAEPKNIDISKRNY